MVKSNSFRNISILFFFVLAFTPFTSTSTLANTRNEKVKSLFDYQRIVDTYLIEYNQNMEAGNKEEAMKKAYTIAHTYVSYLLEFNEGIKYNNIALQLAKELNNTDYEILSLQQLGYIHYSWGDTEAALSFYREALDLAEKVEDYKSVITICTYLSDFLEEEYRIKEALIYYEKIVANKHNLKYGPRTLMAIGRYYRLIDNIDSTFLYFNNALEIFDKDNNIRWVSYTYAELADAYLSIDSIDKAFENANNGLDTALKYNLKKEKYDNYLILSTVHEKDKNYENALKYYRLYTEVKDSINSSENKQNLDFLRLKLKFEEEEKAYSQLKNEKKITEIESSNRKYSNYALFFGIILLLSILIIGYYRFMIIKKQNKEIEKSYQNERLHVKEKETLLQEVHHRVKNNMQIISSLLSLQQSTQKDEKSIELLEQSKYRIQAMAMIHEMLYQKENMGLINYEGYLQKLGKSLITALNVHNCKIDLDINAPEINLNIDTAVPLGLIINEILTNSLKYGFEGVKEGRIHVTIENIGNKRFILKIGDDGNGFDYSEKVKTSDSLGLQLIETLSEQLNGVVKILPTKGTHYLISFEEI